MTRLFTHGRLSQTDTSTQKLSQSRITGKRRDDHALVHENLVRALDIEDTVHRLILALPRRLWKSPFFVRYDFRLPNLFLNHDDSVEVGAALGVCLFR